MKTLVLPLMLVAGISQAVPPGGLTSAPAFLDVNGDGLISEAERQAYTESRANANAQGQGGKLWDGNGDGTVDESERQVAVAELKKRMDTKVASLFEELAGDDGLLTLKEFSTLPRFDHRPPQVAANLFSHLDTDGDGVVTLEEFFKETGRGKPPAGETGHPR
ncbi:EF-hand domain-containing protein [Luteolibacter soli]|uniref:EF-hand domain-containing protein n=1 Tax=Luteolibacter soli TaxID=3135280 RepID=A0ABU9AVH8_9BACT